ncbi:MAG: hypothetical protein JMDDDDMK_01067 [Acidobacteria bacterium]|nr:hypothetical protein [Acidobacteriota bacterium]
MARAVKPLIEEPVQIPPRRLFNRGFEIVGLGVPEFVLVQVMRQRSEERVVAQFPPEHIQHALAFFVSVPVHHVFGKTIAVRDNRSAVARAIFAQVSQEVLEQNEARLVASARVFIPEVFAVSRKAFVEPDVRPVFASHQIAPPLMRQFVRDDVVVTQINRRVVVQQAAVGEGRSRSVLHRAEQKVVHQNLRVFRIWISVSELVLEEFDHLRC